MLWVVLSIVLLMGLAYLLFVPLDIVINIANNEYFFQIRGLAKVAVEGHEKEFLRIRLNTLFTKFYFYPLRKKKKGAKKKVEKKSGVKVDFTSNFKRGLKVLKSFEVKQMIFDIDTGNCILNAKLYPAFALLDYYVGTFRVNFEGRVNMVLHLQSSPASIIKSFINI